MPRRILIHASLSLLPILAQAQPTATVLTTPAPPPQEKPDLRHIQADEITGTLDQNANARGRVRLIEGNMVIDTEQLFYDMQSDTAVTPAEVNITRDGDTLTGKGLSLKLDTRVGKIETPFFQMMERAPIPGAAGRKGFGQMASHVRATKMLLEGEDKEHLYDTEYTTCKVDDVEWLLKLRDLELDHAKAIGTGHSASIRFKNVPILYLPYISFPLNNNRKSGFLPITTGYSSTGGLELAVPYYFNLAENYDATLTPKLFARRGLQLGGEFRYQTAQSFGQLDAEYLHNDRVIGRNRMFNQITHWQNLEAWLGTGWSASVMAQKVSDIDYFRDLSTQSASTAQTNLPRDIMLSYSGALGFLSLRRLSYQTLLDQPLPAALPYRLQPQIKYDIPTQRIAGLDFSLSAEHTEFVHPKLVNGKRQLLYPSIAYPIVTSYGFMKPKVGYHMTRYQLGKFSHGYSGGTVSLPIASLDSGLFFERNTQLGGRSFTQTLEPRLFFLSVPYRNQDDLPSFTTTESTFSFPQLFDENLFVGGDRISNAKHISAALTTRYVENSTGIERFRAALGQRYNLRPQLITLPGSALDDDEEVDPLTGEIIRSSRQSRTRSRSDLLASFTGQLTDAWQLDSLFQYSSSDRHFQQSNIALRYKPENGTILNLSYRYTREAAGLGLVSLDSIKQIDISTQMPLNRLAPGWTLLARANHSLRDRRLLEGLFGLEYNRDCWEFRVVVHRLTTATNKYSNAIQLQLELKGLSRIGIGNLLDTLKQNISGYRRSNER